MGTKSTNPKSGSFVSWLCFFLSVSILFTAACQALFVFTAGSSAIAEAKHSVQIALENDPQLTTAFRRDVSKLTRAALLELTDRDSEGNFAKKYPDLKWETANVMLFANEDYYPVLSNTGSTDPESPRNVRLLDSFRQGAPEGYNYLVLFDGDSISIERNGNRVYDTDAMIDLDGYQTYFSDLADKDGEFWEEHPNLSELSLVMVIAPNIRTEQKSAVLSDAVNQLFRLRISLFFSAALLVAAVVLFVIYLFIRRKKAEFDSRIAHLTGNIWLEIKLLFLGSTLWYCFQNVQPEPNPPAETFWPLLLLFWLILFGINDVRYNPQFYLHNLYLTSKSQYLSHQMKRTFQKRLLNSFFLFVLLEAAVMIFFWLISSAIAKWVAAAAALGILLLYFRHFSRVLQEFAQLTDQISQMKNGASYTPLSLRKESDLFLAAEELNSIQSGINHAVEEQVRAERMKIELVTNVSHDIKTPLTSIINYIELLRQEKDLPEHVQDYVEILAGKADRLKKMVQDIFEVSKASTGNIELHLEPLILQKLIQQTLADMEENISESRLALKLDFPQEPVYILADGNRMYRVFQNLFRNALQYSLEGSRIFIQLTVQDGAALTQIKNTSRFALDNLPDVTERFVRGDESRTTDGTGLGLSIAKSFTEACGGTFSVSTNADLFGVTVSFPSVPDPKDEEEENEQKQASSSEKEPTLENLTLPSGQTETPPIESE
ncbi:sensor histidine kinase [Clostridium minihomine]|uniref:sensor histidine kinase n=1 Tax=Clostridium minihomine TaxID=2045012 RepID=UPI000C790122|nr:HAMP domain-containing sensor histidine kinase [Clostridium minihomine]